MSESRESIDELLTTVEEGAAARGASPYIQKYISVSKKEVFNMLVNCKPDEQSLLRVWAWAVGIDALEQDLKVSIEKGRDAREELNKSETPGEPG